MSTERKARRERREHITRWNDAIRENRVVNFGDHLTAYRTPEEALAALNYALDDGIDAFVVPPELARN